MKDLKGDSNSKEKVIIQIMEIIESYISALYSEQIAQKAYLGTFGWSF